MTPSEIIVEKHIKVPMRAAQAEGECTGASSS
jgi:hypothetical protein